MPALTGRFDADFSNFTTAVDGATVKLKGFEADSNKVGQALTRMTDSFSGQKVMQEAALMTEAVERMGGVSQLTTKELQRIAPTVNEAIEKMNLLGVAVPEDMQKIAAATKGVTTEMSGMGDVMGEIQGMVAGAFTVQAVLNFGKQILDTSDAIIKMSDQTGMTIEQVQRLQYVSGQTSVSMESMVSAAQNVTAKLGDDDEGLNAGLKKLNINVDEFRKLDSYTQFMTLATAIGNVKDPTQHAADAAAVFGKNWKEIFPLLNDQMAKLAADATVVADKTVKAVDTLGDRITAAKGRLTGWGAEALSATMTGIEGAASGIMEIGMNVNRALHGNFETLAQEMQRYKDQNDPTGMDNLKASVANIKPALDPVVTSFKMLHLSVKDSEQAAKDLDKAAKDSAESNTANAAALKSLTEQMAKDAEAYWKGVDAIRDRIMGVDAVQTAKQWADAVTDLGGRIDKFSNKDLQSLYDAMQQGLTAMAMQGTLTSAAADEYTKLMVAAQQAMEAIKATKPAVDAASGATTDYTQKLYDAARAEDAQAQAIARKNAQLGATAAAANVGGTDATNPDYTAPSGNVGGPRYQEAPLGQPPQQGYAPRGATTSGSGAGSSYYVPPKADGGPVAAGRSYFVGERGPELFTPTSNGSITPNGSGAVVVQNTFHIVDTESAIAQRVSENILRSIKQARRV